MSKHKITLTDIIKEHRNTSYEKLYEQIVADIYAGKLQPIIRSGLNGKNPALYQAYWQIEEEENLDALQEELEYALHPQIALSYYRSHLQQYQKERVYVRQLSDFFARTERDVLLPATLNERSFEIFHREKFLEKEGGMTVLKHAGVELTQLRVYATREPLAYYTKNRTPAQQILISENKDPFYSMRKALDSGKTTLFGIPFETLIYGAGKAIYKSFADYTEGVEQYFCDTDNVLWYFGDLDYEGIRIYETFRTRYAQVTVRLCIPAYEKMLEKAERLGFAQLPDMKEKQKKTAGNTFFAEWPSYQDKILTILEQGKYIPQEILQVTDY